VAGPLDTIGKAVRANMLFTVACQCGNTRHYRAIDIGMVVGLGRHPDTVRFGCTRCKSPTPPKVTLANARREQPTEADRVDALQGRARRNGTSGCLKGLS
jgi:hypothetical protein